MSDINHIDRALSFKGMIKDGTIRRADAMKARYQDIHVEPGFNLRDETPEFHDSVRALADYIKEGGVYPPLEVRVRPEGGVWIVDGHRRHAAIGLAIAEGAPIEWVEIRQFVGNDADRTARIITSAEGRPLSPLETARGYKRLASFGLSPAEIAKRVGRTATHVESLLLLANANTDVQHLVRDGGVSATLAIQTVRQRGESAGQFLGEHIQAARAAGKTKVTPKSISGEPRRARKPRETSAFDLISHLERLRQFSQRTFGPRERTAGVLDHIRKELDEVAADPTDTSGWIDVAILAFDGAMRAGAAPEQVVASLLAKQERGNDADSDPPGVPNG